MMVGVDQRGLGVQNIGQAAVRFDGDGMVGLAMGHGRADLRRDVLDHGAARHHIGELHAQADTQDWLFAGHPLGD